MSAGKSLQIPQFEGEAARQAHADLPADCFERELGREGFFGPASHMYHRNPPTAWSSIEGPIRPRALRPRAVAEATHSPWQTATLAHNSTIAVRYWTLHESMAVLARNADGDDLLFVHSGGGALFCDYGHLTIEAGDYVVLPRGTMWRIELETGQAPLEALLIEATGSAYRLPERGLLGHHAPFDPGVMARPVLDARFNAQPRGGRWQVDVKRGGQIGHITYDFNPLDAIGWKGDQYPVRLNMRDIRGVSSHRLHLPPSVRTTFIADRFVVCSLVPRPVETDPGAVKLPFFHSNDDYDELIFYHSGVMSSRGGAVQLGELTFHPAGFTHGPHPQTLPHLLNHPATMFTGYSIAIDTRDPLQLVTPPEGGEITDYAQSWSASIVYAPDADRNR